MRSMVRDEAHIQAVALEEMEALAASGASDDMPPRELMEHLTRRMAARCARGCLSLGELLSCMWGAEKVYPGMLQLGDDDREPEYVQ